MTIEELMQDISRDKNMMAIYHHRVASYAKEALKINEETVEIKWNMMCKIGALNAAIFDLMLHTPCYKFERVLRKIGVKL